MRFRESVLWFNISYILLNNRCIHLPFHLETNVQLLLFTLIKKGIIVSFKWLHVYVFFVNDFYAFRLQLCPLAKSQSNPWVKSKPKQQGREMFHFWRNGMKKLNYIASYTMLRFSVSNALKQVLTVWEILRSIPNTDINNCFT